MDDLVSKLQNILSTKEGQEQLKNIQAMLGMSGQPLNSQSSNPQQESQSDNQNSSQQNSGIDFSALLNALGGQNKQNENTEQTENSKNSSPNIDIEMIRKLQQVFQNMNVNDKNSQLLLALKPHFSKERCAKVDQAISMLRLFSLLPMLKESGIFSGL